MKSLEMKVPLQLFCLLAVLGMSGGMTAIRGADPDFSSFFDPAKNFQCLDGSKILEFSHINDDYCDCPDGSDEPGTAACSNGSFFCVNTGFRAGKIPSSRVNDGICDCCDGTDEWESSSCKDVCYEMGAQARAERARKQQILEEGLRLKEDLIFKGQELFKLKKEELALKEKELKDYQEQKDALSTVKEEKESLERAALEVYREIEERERVLKEEEEKQKKEAELLDKFSLLDVNSDGKIEALELQSNIRFDQNNDGIVSEEEAAFYMSGLESYDLESFKSQGLALLEPALDNKVPPPKEVNPDDDHPKEDMDYDDLEEEDDEVRPPHLGGGEEEDDGEDLELDKVEEETKEEGGSPKYDEETQRLIEEANKARTEYDAVDRKVRDLENDISHLKQVIESEYGSQKEFLPLSKECFEFTDQEYVYKMCTFDHCTQRSKNGGSETRLGDWSHWSQAFSEMKYEKGTQCWNGPQRSTAVHVSCGTENKLTAVREPSKCEYVFEFESPAACSQSSLADGSAHDEL